MNLTKFNELPNGLYRIYWKKKEGGRISVAAIGPKDPTTHGRWVFATNWLSPSNSINLHESIKKVELITLQ